MNPRNIILTGVPRSGTTLCCKLLGLAADTVALIEPLPVPMEELPASHADVVRIMQLYFHGFRTQLLESGTTIGHHVNGALPDNFFDEHRTVPGGIRQRRKMQSGEIRVDKSITQKFTLIIKHNAAFTALLPALVPVFDCYALVRNPLAVLASWNSVNLPVASGRLPAGERLDRQLATHLNAQAQVLQRQLSILDWFFGQFHQHLALSHIIRYEDVVSSGGMALAAATGVPIPQQSLTNRNANRLYAGNTSQQYADALYRNNGAWRHFYSPQDIKTACAALLDRQ